MRVTRKEYNAICDVIDRVKLDDKPEDTDVYADGILKALGLGEPALSDYGIGIDDQQH